MRIMRLAYMLLVVLALAVPVAYAGIQSVGPVTISPSPIDLTAGSTTKVNCTAQINDSDGSGSIIFVNATIWDPAAASENSPDDNTNHYSASVCGKVGHGMAYAIYACNFSLYYYVNPSSWSCKIRSYNSTMEGVGSQGAVTVSPLTALELSASDLDFGTVSHSGQSPDINISVTNRGNVAIDVNVSGTDFSCSSGSIGAEYTRFSASPGTDYGSMTPLSSASTTLAIDIAQQNRTELSQKPIFWKVSVPASGASGTCTNTISLVANQRQG